MKQTLVNLLGAVNHATLTPLVQTIVDGNLVQIIDWNYSKIHGGGGDSYDTGQAGVYRFEGNAYVDGETVAWRLILKVFERSTGQTEPSHLHYWQRERDFYESKLLSNVPTQITHPYYFGVEKPVDGIIGVWLEDVVDTLNGQWPLEHFGIMAQHLGQMNGALRDFEAKPGTAWFSNGRINPWLTMAAPQIERIPDVLDHPNIRRWLTPANATRTLKLWERRPELLAIYARLPKAFCHHDAHRRNLFARTDHHKRMQTVAIDWAFAGIGVVGEDIATLMTVEVQFGEMTADKLPQLDKVIFEGYLLGLRETGWQEDPNLVRLGFTVSAALTWALSTLWWMIPAVVDAEFQIMAATVVGTSIDNLVDEWAGLQAYLLDLADEALSLGKRFP